jgi:two-component sensor histidine kinase
VATKEGLPFGVLEVDSQTVDAFDEDDVTFLTSFANILAEAVASAARLARMKELVAEKEVLSKELKHRVRNSLHLVYGLLNAELQGQHAEVSTVAIRSISQRVMGLAQIFDHLLGRGMSKIINFGEYAAALCKNIPILYAEKNIRLTCEADRLALNLDDATAMGIIITELVNNAYLHAFPDHVGEIAVALHSQVGTNVAVLTISDDGIGCEEAETTLRRGMGLVRRLVKQVGGTLALQSEHGSTWTITLPVSDLVLPKHSSVH